MKINLVLFTILLLVITGICTLTPTFAELVEQKITITADKSLYSIDDAVKISGRVSEIDSGYPVTLRIKAPNGNLMAAKQLDVNPDKTFSLTINAGEYSWKPDGTYTIIAQYGSKSSEAQTTFRFYDDTSPSTSKLDDMPKNDETFTRFQNYVMANFNNTYFLMVLVLAVAGISAPVVYYLRKHHKTKPKIKSERIITQPLRLTPEQIEIRKKQEEERKRREEEKKPQEQIKPESVIKGEDPYKILGVRQNVTCTELKSKFRELAKKYSPDHGIVNMTEQEKEQKTRMFIKIKKAHDELRKSKNCKD